VLERWLHQRRLDVRWVTIPRTCARTELLERCEYVLGRPATSALRASAGVPVAASG
jgi:hypothetical protein